MAGATYSTEKPPFMRVDGLAKSFGPIEVLRDIALDIREGEIHTVIGENGAGKSTLMKLLAGHLKPSKGELFIDGKPVVLTGPVDAEQRGIVLVHQEILLAPDMTVAQNIFLGREQRKGLVLNDRSMNAQARAAVQDLGADIEPTTRVENLSIAQRQLVQIARALLVPHRLVIFDEPTASLTPIETEALLKVITGICDRGAAVLYISHRLPEVKTIADRVTVLRDGKMITTREAEGNTCQRAAALLLHRPRKINVSKQYIQVASSRATVAVMEWYLRGLDSQACPSLLGGTQRRGACSGVDDEAPASA